MLSHQLMVLWAPPTSFATTSEFRITYINVFRIANPYCKRSPTFSTNPSVFTPSLLLRQFIRIYSTVDPPDMAGFEIVNTLPKSARAFSKLMRVHACALRLEYLITEASASFSQSVLTGSLQGEQSIALMGFTPTG